MSKQFVIYGFLCRYINLWLQAIRAALKNPAESNGLAEFWRMFSREILFCRKNYEKNLSSHRKDPFYLKCHLGLYGLPRTFRRWEFTERSETWKRSKNSSKVWQIQLERLMTDLASLVIGIKRA